MSGGEGAQAGGGFEAGRDDRAVAGFAEERGIEAGAELSGDLHSDGPGDGRLGERDRQTAVTAVVGRAEEASFRGFDEAIDEATLGVEVDLDGAGG